MTTKIFRIVTLLLTLIIVFSCSKKEESNTSSNQSSFEKFESVDLKGEKVFLRYKFDEGDKFQYKLTSISSSDESIKDDSLITASSIQAVSYIFDIEVFDIDADNIAEMKINISSIKLDADINGEKVKYDSKSTLSQEDKTKFLEYETFTNSPYRARVNQKGEVIEVFRLDKMIDKMNSLQPQKQNLTREQKTQLAKNLSEAAVRPITQLLFRELPEDSIAKDSTWEKRYLSQLSVFQIENIAVYKVEDIVKVNDDKAAKFSANLSVTWSGNKKGEENGIKYNFEDPKITGGGKILFNIDKGQIVRAETSTRIELSVQLEGKDQSQKVRKTTRKDISTNKNIVELL